MAIVLSKTPGIESRKGFIQPGFVSKFPNGFPQPWLFLSGKCQPARGDRGDSLPGVTGQDDNACTSSKNNRIEKEDFEKEEEGGSRRRMKRRQKRRRRRRRRRAYKIGFESDDFLSCANVR